MYALLSLVFYSSCRYIQAVAHDAFRALVNLSDSPMIHPHLIEPLFFTFLVSYIVVSLLLPIFFLTEAYSSQNPQATLGDLAAMLLSNLTTSPGSCTALLALHIPLLQTPSSAGPFYPTQSRAGSCAPPVPYPKGTEVDMRALPLLVDAFAQGANVDLKISRDKRLRKSDLPFLASVFANLSTVSMKPPFDLASTDKSSPSPTLVVFSSSPRNLRTH